MRRRALVASAVLLGIVTVLFVFAGTTRSLKGSVTDDAVLTLLDADHNGSLSIREMRNGISGIIHAIVTGDLSYDLNGDQAVNRSDLSTLIASLRSFLGAQCGNGAVEAGEQCDDHGTANGDGCSSSCKIEPGYQCSGSPSVCGVCGDGVKQGSEACDDGGTANGDGCSAACTVEPGFICSGSAPSSCAPQMLTCKRISCTQFASHYGAQYHQLTYDGLDNTNTPFYTGCETYGTQYRIRATDGQITSNGTCAQSNPPTGTPVDGTFANLVAGMLNIGITQPPSIVVSPPSITAYFAVMNGHDNKVTFGATGFTFYAESCGIEEYSCQCITPEAVDPQFCYLKK